MHELSVCRGLLRQVEHIAQTRAATAVEKIVLRIGPLSGVEPRLLQAAFEVASSGTLAERAHLRIETTALRLKCLSCGAESESEPSRLSCPRCGEWRTQLLSGDELLLAGVELTL